MVLGLSKGSSEYTNDELKELVLTHMHKCKSRNRNNRGKDAGEYEVFDAVEA